MLGMQPPASPVTQRMRHVRRRVTTGVLATFVAAWLAVAALGKGGSASSPSTTALSARDIYRQASGSVARAAAQRSAQGPSKVT